MAARKFAIRQDDQTRAKIQAAQIINRLHKCIMGELELSSQQVSAAKILLGKVIPDLSAVEQTTEVTVRNVVEMPAPVKTTDEWQSTVATQH